MTNLKKTFFAVVTEKYRPAVTRNAPTLGVPIFFSNERNKGSYMIISQPNRGELTLKSLSEEHTLTLKLLASGEAPLAAVRKVPRVNIR